MSETVLSVRDLSVTYAGSDGPVRAARDVSFTVQRGETLGIVGESGCGKTTVVRSLIGLLPSKGVTVSGEIGYGGRNLARLSERELRSVRGREISMIFQDPMSALNPVLRVGEQIEESRRAQSGLGRRARTRRAVELLELVGVPAAAARLRQHPHEFSGGMRQRVLIAIALASGPKVLLADEPTTALDVTTQAQILALLQHLQAELGMAVVLVTHNLGIVAEMCERVAVMYAGEVVETGATEDLLVRPRHPYTAGLVASLPSMQPGSRYLQVVPGGPPSLAQTDATCAFAPRCTLAEPECERWTTELLDAGPGAQSRCRRHPELVA
jgi:oligopeptide/dipeptide ABC transporter ATP-binding protein